MSEEVVEIRTQRISQLPITESISDKDSLVANVGGVTKTVKKKHLLNEVNARLDIIIQDVENAENDRKDAEALMVAEIEEINSSLENKANKSEVDNDINELDVKIAENKSLTDSEISRLKEIANTWETFKSNGGEIGGQIILPYGISLSGRASEDAPRDMIHIQRGGMITVGDQNNGLILTSKSRPQIWEESTPKLIVVNDDFPISKDTNGYTKLPNGLIMQWGETPVFGRSGYTVLFPISFPNSTLTISVTSYTKNAFYSEEECKVGTKDKYAFNVWGNVDQRVLWIAIGY